MEDRDKSKGTKSESIVDLTPDMEVTDASQIEIIDLTDIVDGPDEIPPSGVPVEETPTASEPPASRPFSGNTVSSAIEKEVEAAFDFVQSPISEATQEEPPQSDHKGLMDKLSDIPQLVDDALDDSGAQDNGMEDDDKAADAAAGTDEADDEIIELTDIVDPGELEAAGLKMEEDDEIIELTDIVDPSEFEAAGLIMEEEDEIIELTDIVDPAELHVGAAEPEDTGAVQPAASGAPDEAGLEDQEYEDLLEMIDTLDADDLLMDLAEEANEGLEPASREPDVEETEAAAADAAGPETGDAPDEDREYEDLLETIDSLDPEDLLVSVDEAGLLESGQEAGEADEEEGLVTLTDVLNRNNADTVEMPPVERVSGVIREVEEETGRDVKTLTDLEVEAAVERILKTKYAETIERLIAKAVEKAVNREIENLKRTMLDDD
ncbi:MAG: hypothetical protein P8Z73_11240 [Desulfobacteraceae bacterium]